MKNREETEKKMMIRSITIENFRGIKFGEIKDLGSINIILGPISIPTHFPGWRMPYVIYQGTGTSSFSSPPTVKKHTGLFLSQQNERNSIPLKSTRCPLMKMASWTPGGATWKGLRHLLGAEEI